MYSTQSGDYMYRYTFSDPVYLRAIMEWKKNSSLKLCSSSLLWLEVNGLNAQNWDLFRGNEVPVHKVWPRALSQFPNMYTERVEAFEKLTYAEDKGQCMKESFYCRSFYDQSRSSCDSIRACLTWFLRKSNCQNAAVKVAAFPFSASSFDS